ncbi:DUF503 domain-containing protein [Clostridium massiliamazoniense]|uniref:DUF503 domain-containing protein n=1 Tax=Clostridium massiliamazoniense TaxID=1347366 RepID=UPI0006D8234A|nr:DUF503 domain-containing protein [Clostridium massiliamazoniense]
MKILVMEIKIRVSFVNSLKEKRMILRSIREKVKNKFNVSISEVDSQDNHKLITFGISSVSSEKDLLNNLKEKIIDYIEGNFEGEIIGIYEEIENY